jgi:pimeloyl-ACP methyl ester carboxylesterase
MNRRRWLVSLVVAAVLATIAILLGPLGPTRPQGSTSTSTTSAGAATTDTATATADTAGAGGPTATTAAAVDTLPTQTGAFDATSIAPQEVPAGTTPGELLDHVAANADGSLVRIRYSSVGSAGTPIAETGLVAIPPGTPPAAGWPILSVGHPTVGSADICAPSVNTSGFAGAAQIFTKFGYLVVMSDYEGLGTTGPHTFLDGHSEGRAVLDAARAARQLDVPTTDQLTLWGISQGGQAVLFAAELASTWAPDLRLVATVAEAPASGGIDLFRHVATTDERGFAVLAVAGLGAADHLDPATVLTPAAQPLLQVVDEQCSEAVKQAAASVNGDLVDLGALATDPWAAAIDAQQLGTVGIASPLLIVHGTADPLIPIAYSEALVERYRKLGTPVEFLSQSGAGHGDVALSSLTAVVAWLAQH